MSGTALHVCKLAGIQALNVILQNIYQKYIKGLLFQNLKPAKKQLSLIQTRNNLVQDFIKRL